MRTALTALATLSLSFTLMAADPFVGTWKLNVEKSTLKGRNADIASETMTMSETGPNAYQIVIESVSKTGETRHQEFNRNYDGKEHEVKGGETEIDLRVNTSTHRVIGKKDGKETGELTVTVSPDGKVTTNRFSNGQVQIFEKQ